MRIQDAPWLFILAATGYMVGEWFFPGYGICGGVIGAVIAIVFRQGVARMAPWLFERPKGGRIHRTLTYFGLFVALLFFGSCVWTLTPRTWSTREKPAQMLVRIEGTYHIRFPTNVQVVNSKAWWESGPRTSDKRHTALHMRCDTTSWIAVRNSFGTNFFGPFGSENSPGNLYRHAPWITTIKSNWDRYSGKFQTRDTMDNWLRVHWCDIYFAPPAGTNQEAVVLAWDTRSEVNW